MGRWVGGPAQVSGRHRHGNAQPLHVYGMSASVSQSGVCHSHKLKSGSNSGPFVFTKFEDDLPRVVSYIACRSVAVNLWK